MQVDAPYTAGTSFIDSDRFTFAEVADGYLFSTIVIVNHDTATLKS